MSFFDSIQKYPIDPILGLQALYNQDARTHKVNLGIGTYQNEQGNPVVFQAVRKAEELLFSKNLNKNYLSIEGYPALVSAGLKLIFGEKVPPHIFGMQTVGGTSALRIALEFINQRVSRSIFLSDPTWVNHNFVCEHLKFNVEPYPYYDPLTGTLHFDRLLQKIAVMPPGSTILLHACCHNPTGIDPTREQWKELSKALKKSRILPFFDFAYQGLGKNLEEDAWAIRYFLKEGHEMFVAYSFSKNLGLYGERVGMLAIVTEEDRITQKIVSQIKHQTRMIYSTPALHGGRLAGTVLENESLSLEWKEELAQIKNRIIQMRKILADEIAKKASFDLEIIKNHQGMFSLLPLSNASILALRDNFGIYLLENGRINLSGLNENNVDYVIDSLTQLLKKELLHKIV